jgi:hypothetical protein
MSGYHAGYGIFVDETNVLASWIMAESERNYFRVRCLMKVGAIWLLSVSGT